MEWKKYSVEDQFINLTGVLSVFLCFLSFYLHSFLIFFIAVFLLLFLFSNSFYLKHVGKRLYLENKKVRNRFFPEETGDWILAFENKGFPIMKGNLRIYFDDQVAPLEGFGDKRLTKYEVNIPVSLNYNQKTQIKIPFKTIRRGVAKIRLIELHIPHLFGLGETVLEYKNIFMQEALVYPLPIPVKNKDLFLSGRPGESYVNISLYEDYLLPAGTRQYVFSDSFNRIHWKASAKTNTLQTKIYDRVAETGWNLSLNIASGHAITSQAEGLISSAAELAHYSAKHHIPFSLCINIRVAGSIPFYYIPPGTGSEQLQKVLEALALVDPYSSIYPYERMLSFYERHMANQPFFIHGGNREGRAGKILQLFKKRGISLLELNLEEEAGAVLTPLPFQFKDVVGQ
ncbi:DUF58 domain-containing protein [Bacillus sp. S/N-304-OC-R1]|uniref:DUF58 domain-containing protein n=1 Tax=Bacillus sp. S/N-304-OC-R1 TaxID=2758034 RepID=UPI001C8EF7FC|nr:DUF58 domain-containing protein [Bacillus sp. S/N-304-OC-R1]MBY0120900.1 DUF58 domain-containing protein [Bacillus sp. S/N-304-OC-R1]